MNRKMTILILLLVALLQLGFCWQNTRIMNRSLGYLLTHVRMNIILYE